MENPSYKWCKWMILGIQGFKDFSIGVMMRFNSLFTWHNELITITRTVCGSSMGFEKWWFPTRWCPILRVSISLYHHSISFPVDSRVDSQTSGMMILLYTIYTVLLRDLKIMQDSTLPINSMVMFHSCFFVFFRLPEGISYLILLQVSYRLQMITP